MRSERETGVQATAAAVCSLVIGTVGLPEIHAPCISGSTQNYRGGGGLLIFGAAVPCFLSSVDDPSFSILICWRRTNRRRSLRFGGYSPRLEDLEIIGPVLTWFRKLLPLSSILQESQEQQQLTQNEQTTIVTIWRLFSSAGRPWNYWSSTDLI